MGVNKVGVEEKAKEAKLQEQLRQLRQFTIWFIDEFYEISGKAIPPTKEELAELAEKSLYKAIDYV